MKTSAADTHGTFYFSVLRGQSMIIIHCWLFKFFNYGSVGCFCLVV